MVSRFYWNFMRWQIYLNVLVNLLFKFIFGTEVTCHLFAFHDTSSTSPLFVLVFISNVFCCWKCSFHAHYDVYSTITFLRNYSNLSWIIISKSVNTSFVWTLHFFVYFSSKEVLQGLSKNNPAKKEIDAPVQTTMKHKRLENVQRRKCFTGYCNKLPLNVFSINFAVWITFYYCYYDPEIPS